MKPLIIVTSIILFFFSLRAYAEITVIDDAGEVISLKQAAKRVISLSPGTTELIFSAGGGHLIKGAVSYSDYPEAAKRIPQIGSYNAVDLEKIVSLNPDLIIAWQSGNPPLQISKLKKMGLTVFISEPRELSDIPSSIKKFGILLATETTADKAINKFNARLNELTNKYTGKFKTKSVFIQIWNTPIMSINGQHLISKIVANCNGRNIFTDYPQLTLTPSVETVISANPDVIIASRQGNLGEKWLRQWRKWHFLSAVKKHRLFTANPDNLVRHTPRILNGMEEVCALINAN